MTIDDYLELDKPDKKNIDSLRNHLNSTYPIDVVINKTKSKWESDKHSFTFDSKKTYSFCEKITKYEYVIFINQMNCKHTAFLFKEAKNIVIKKSIN